MVGRSPLPDLSADELVWISLNAAGVTGFQRVGETRLRWGTTIGNPSWEFTWCSLFDFSGFLGNPIFPQLTACIQSVLSVESGMGGGVSFAEPPHAGLVP